LGVWLGVVLKERIHIELIGEHDLRLLHTFSCLKPEVASPIRDDQWNEENKCPDDDAHEVCYAELKGYELSGVVLLIQANFLTEN
jgi:hypothetical protein